MSETSPQETKTDEYQRLVALIHSHNKCFLEEGHPLTQPCYWANDIPKNPGSVKLVAIIGMSDPIILRRKLRPDELEIFNKTRHSHTWSSLFDILSDENGKIWNGERINLEQLSKLLDSKH